MEHQKWQVNERRTLNIEPRTSNYATCRPPWSTVLTRGLTPPAGLDLHFCIPNLRSACSLPAGVGSAEEIGDLVLQAGGSISSFQRFTILPPGAIRIVCGTGPSHSESMTSASLSRSSNSAM